MGKRPVVHAHFLSSQHPQEIALAIDETKLNDFMGRFVGDLGAVMHAATIVVGDQFGLYKRLAEGPTDVESLARLTETDPGYLREWLSAQAASGYVQYDAATQLFSLSEEQAFALAQEGSPGLHPRCVSDRSGAVQGDPEDDAGDPNRSGPGLA